MHDHFGDQQFAVGHSAATERLARSVQVLAEAAGLAVGKLDGRSAFNGQFRAVAFAELELACPEVVPFFAQLYDRRSTYVMRIDGADPATLLADHGWDQGDPFGPIGYSLGERHALASAVAEVRAYLLARGVPAAVAQRSQVWAYLDDVILVVPAEHLAACMDIVVAALAPTGYVENRAKREAWAPGGEAPAGDGLAWNPEGIVVTGCPVAELVDWGYADHLPAAIGQDSFRARVAQAILERARPAVDAVQRLPQLAATGAPAIQVGLLLLRNTILPRTTHLFRLTFTDAAMEHARQFDALVRKGFEALTGVAPVTDAQLLQLALPCRSAGLGFAAMEVVAPAAHIGSWAQTLRGVQAVAGLACYRVLSCRASPCLAARRLSTGGSSPG